MGNSLQDQLLKAGLATEKQAKKAKAGMAPKKRGKKGQSAQPSESARAAQQASAEKAARDRALNEQRRTKASHKEMLAQVRQLVEQNRLSREGAEVGYNFVSGGKIRKLYVTPEIQAKLTKGAADIVRLDGRYEVVLADVAEKIRTRDANLLVPRPAVEDQPTDDDPYKDFQVPDDLMW